MLKAYLIDPTNQTVTEHQISGDYKEIQKLGQYRAFDVVRLDDGDGVFVDDEGLMNGTPQTIGMFLLTGTARSVALAGRGVVLGCDDEGESQDANISLEALTAMVSFPTLAELRSMASGGMFD